MAILTQRNKNYCRPRKSGAAKRRRVQTQRRRLVALGLSAELAQTLNHKQLRARLKAQAQAAAQARRTPAG